MEPPAVPEPSYSLYGSKAYGIQTTANQTVKANETKMVLDTGKREDFVEVVRAEIEPVFYGEYDLNEMLYTIVNALQNVSKEKYFGVTILTDVLRGRNTKRIYENRLHLVKEFGALKDLPHDTVVAVIDWMISEKLILKTKGKYPVLHSTYEGLHYSEIVTELKLKRLKKYLEEEVILWN